MKISGKISLYTGITTLLVGVMIILYFILLLPGLYVDYKQKAQLESVATIQDNYTRGIRIMEMEEEALLSVFAITLPKEGNIIHIDSSFGGVSVEIKDTELRSVLNDMRKDLNSIDYDKLYETIGEIEFDKYSDFFRETFETNKVESKIHIVDVIEEEWGEESIGINRIYRTPGGSAIFYAYVDVYGNQYTNYFGIGEGEAGYYFVVASNVTPKLKELTPILLQSAPMIIVILLLFSLCIAYFFSKILAAPIKILAKEATKMKALDEVEAICLGRKDEFHELERALNQLYFHLKGLLRKEKEMNTILKQEQEKQELFMMNASHQLKTPVAAALLLVEGMLGKVGKYKDVEGHLPLVKEELMQMQQIVYEVLDVFKNVHQGLVREEVDVQGIIKRVLEKHKVLLEEKAIKITIELGKCERKSDAEMLYAVLDNLFSNAVRYTPKGGDIKVFLNQERFCIENTGVQIAEKIKEQIFEPFVSFSREAKEGHGLGLYLVSLYVKMLGIDMKIENGENSVVVEGRFDEDV